MLTHFIYIQCMYHSSKIKYSKIEMKNPQIQVLWLLRKTAMKWLQCVPVPFVGAVLMGYGCGVDFAT